MGSARKPLKEPDPQPMATHGNGSGAHGKEGVNGSSPLEGFTAGHRLQLQNTPRSVAVSSGYI
jgi:hypothetical protein